jgi:tetratricopeptide (TPR) repeat protein
MAAIDNRGRLEQFEGDLARARATLEEARSLDPGVGAEEILSSTLYRLGNVAEAEGRLVEARELYEQSMEVTSMLPAADHSCALRELGHLSRLRGDYAEARVRLEECVALRQRLGHSASFLAHAHCQLAEVALIQGDYATATSLAGRCLARLHSAKDPHAFAQAVRVLGRAAYEQGDLPQARKVLEDAHSHIPPRSSFQLDLDHAELLAALGERDQAQAQLAEILTILRRLKNHPGLSHLLRTQGRVELQRGEWERAAVSFRESLSLLQERGIREGVPECLEGLAGVAVAGYTRADGEPGCCRPRARLAARLLGAAEAMRQATGAPLPPIYRCGQERLVDCLRVALGEEEMVAVWDEGRTMPLEQAMCVALEGGVPKTS